MRLLFNLLVFFVPTPTINFGKHFTYLRKMRGFTSITELHEEIHKTHPGTSLSKLYRLEKGAHPNLEEIAALCTALNVTADYLLRAKASPMDELTEGLTKSQTILLVRSAKALVREFKKFNMKRII